MGAQLHAVVRRAAVETDAQTQAKSVLLTLLATCRLQCAVLSVQYLVLHGGGDEMCHAQCAPSSSCAAPGL